MNQKLLFIIFKKIKIILFKQEFNNSSISYKKNKKILKHLRNFKNQMNIKYELNLK